MDDQPPAASEEWRIIQTLLPPGWEEKARELKAFRRARYLEGPGDVLRLLLFHAVNNAGLRNTVGQAGAAGLPSMSAVALFKRLCTAGPWLRWLALEMCRQLRERPALPDALRPRAVDSTTIQNPAATTSNWRVHYALDLVTMGCDWHQLTDARGAEGLERTPVRAGDVLIGDRNYLRVKGVRAVVAGNAHVLVRMGWAHPRLIDEHGEAQHALSLSEDLQVGEVGDWPVFMPGGDGPPIAARVISLKLPRPLAEQAEQRAKRCATRKQKKLNPHTLEAASFVMLFTTLPAELLNATDVANLYRFRWQIEIAFKRHKQLLGLGRLPHKDPRAAEAWILSKLVVALLLETIYRRAVSISPWGYSLDSAIVRAT